MPKLLVFRELREEGVILSRRQIDRLEAEGEFPRRVKISEGRVGWVKDEIVAWLKKKMDARK